MSTWTVPQEVIRFVLDGIFPPVCIGCAKEGAWVCKPCLERIPLVGQVERPIDSSLSTILAISSYQDPIIGGLIRSFKYQRALCLEEEALRPVLNRFATEIDFPSLLISIPTMIVPLPMDPERERVRGVDHALQIARLVQSTLFPEVPVIQALTRTRTTQTNAGLMTAEARAANVQNVFACRAGMEGESILLVDDVYTTGATLTEASQTLKRADAALVQACVLAVSHA